MDKEVVLSWKRIKAYLKMYWWIIAVAAVLGLIMMMIGIKSNIASNQSSDDKVMQKTTFLVSLEENAGTLSTASVIGDYMAVLNTEEFLQKINSKLKDEGIQPKKESYKMEVARIDSSNCFTIDIESDSKQNAEIAAEVVKATLKSSLEMYQDKVEIYEIDKSINKVTTETESSFVLKDLMIFVGMVILGFVIVYLILIFDKRIASADELIHFIKKEDILIIGKKSDYCKIDTLFRDGTNDNTTLILGDQTEELSKEISDKGLECVSIDEAERYLLNKAVTKNIYLAVRSMKTSRTELEKVKEILVLQELAFKKVFFMES